MIEAITECGAVCEHVHLPLQSGSARILKAMRRTYTPARYLKLVEELRAAIPDLALGTDVIVGFPGETEADFEATLAVVEAVGYDSAFTFVYSPRAGTEAASMREQVPHEVKIERMERLVEHVQRIAHARNQARVGLVEEVLVEGPSRTDETLLRGRTRRNTTVVFAGDAAPGELVAVRIEGGDLDDAQGRPGRAGGRMRVLITGSCGQIGTNLALRLLADGHEVLGVDKRQNAWTDAFPTLLQDLAGHYPAYPGGIGGVEYPEVDAVVHLAAHAKVHQLVAEPHRALENAVMTFNVLEYARGLGLPLLFSSSREVYGDIHRFEGYNEETADFAFTESPYSASKIAGEALIYSYARCYGLPYVVFRFSNVYGRFDNDLHRMVRVIPLFVHRLSRGEPITVYGREKTLDFTYVEDCVDGIARGVEALVERRVVNETINLAFGEGNTLVRMAELIAAELGVDPDMTVEPSLLGEVTRYVADIRKARELLGWEPQTSLDEGIPKAVAWFKEHRAAHPGGGPAGRGGQLDRLEDARRRAVVARDPLIS